LYHEDSKGFIGSLQKKIKQQNKLVNTNGQVEYAFKYDIDIEEGDFKIEVNSNGEILEDTQWTSVDQEKLESENL
jgi:hypothetical protein